jgi:glycosyltransferase involved in cell wall biosynthesis
MHTGKIKVLHIIARFNIGGTARYLSHLLPSLNDEMFETLLVVGGVQSSEVEDSRLLDLNFTRIEPLGRRVNFVNDVRSYLAIRGVIKKFKPDVIHTHTFKAGFLGRLCFFKLPKIHTYHGHLLTDPEFSKFAIRIIVLSERLLASFTRFLVATGEQVAKDLIKVRIGKQSQYLSLPGEILPMELLSRSESRRKLGLEDEFTILWMGRVAPVKNPELLLQIAMKMPHLTFVMAGDGTLLKKIKATAPVNVKILGFVDPQEVLTAGDIFLSTSLNEGVPYSLMEAQQAGLPIVAIDCGSISELVKDGENGFLVEANVNQLVWKIQELYTKQDLLQKMGSSAKSLSQVANSGENFVLRHETLYKNILNLN